MDSRALWFSAASFVARLAIALWFALLALGILDRRRSALAWQVALAVATLACSWWVLFSWSKPTWFRPLWFIQSGLAAVVIVNCLRRWIHSPKHATDAVSPDLSVGQPTAPGHGWAHWALTIVGTALSAVAVFGVLLEQAGSGGQMVSGPAWQTLDWHDLLTGAHLLSCAGLLGIACALTLELTFGALGSELLCLAWRSLAGWTSLAWVVQIALACVLMRFGGERQAASVETLMPLLFGLAMILIGYIVWMIPWRMSVFAKQQKIVGQVSLAMAAWLAVLCLSVASGLPGTWPWGDVGSGSRSGSTLSSME